jgi:hypothetical protein
LAIARTRSSILLTLAVTLGIVGGLTGWSAPNASACSCPPPPEPEDAVENADYVFAGEVTEISRPDSDAMREIAFTVSRAWKGVEHQEITIGTPQEGSECGYPFEGGSDYLVYASQNTTRSGPDIITGICNRTEYLSLADNDLLVLGEGTDVDDLNPGESGDGLDLVVLFGGIALFAAIVVTITVLRRWR